MSEPQNDGRDNKDCEIGNVFAEDLDCHRPDGMRLRDSPIQKELRDSERSAQPAGRDRLVNEYLRNAQWNDRGEADSGSHLAECMRPGKSHDRIGRKFKNYDDNEPFRLKLFEGRQNLLDLSIAQDQEDQDCKEDDSYPARDVFHGRILPQNLLHRFALRQLVNQLIQIANLAHYPVLDVFYPNSADHSLDRRSLWIGSRRFCVESFKVRTFLQLFLKLFLTVAGQPTNDLVDLGLGTTLPLGFGNVIRVNLGETCCVEIFFEHGVSEFDCTSYYISIGPVLVRFL